MNVYICSSDELPEWINKGDLPSNGVGREDANYLVVDDSELRECQSDAMEPEDARFTRDLSWISELVLKAYQLGLSRGKAEQ